MDGTLTGTPTAGQSGPEYLSYVPPTYKFGTRPFLRWVRSQGRSQTRPAWPRIPSAPSAFLLLEAPQAPFINIPPPEVGKNLGDGFLRPEEISNQQANTRPDLCPRQARLKVRVDLRVMTMRRDTIFLKVPVLKPHHQIVVSYPKYSLGAGYYPSAKKPLLTGL